MSKGVRLSTCTEKHNRSAVSSLKVVANAGKHPLPCKYAIRRVKRKPQEHHL